MLSYQVFQKRLPPEAVDLVCRFFQYSPNLRCTAVSFTFTFKPAVWKSKVNSPLPLLWYCSWKLVFILSSMNWGIPTLDFQMVAHFLLSSILNLKVTFCKETRVINKCMFCLFCLFELLFQNTCIQCCHNVKNTTKTVKHCIAVEYLSLWFTISWFYLVDYIVLFSRPLMKFVTPMYPV